MHTQTSAGSAALQAAYTHHGLPRWGWLVARGLGALAVLAVGAIHVLLSASLVARFATKALKICW